MSYSSILTSCDILQAKDFSHTHSKIQLTTLVQISAAGTAPTAEIHNHQGTFSLYSTKQPRRKVATLALNVLFNKTLSIASIIRSILYKILLTNLPLTSQIDFHPLF